MLNRFPMAARRTKFTPAAINQIFRLVDEGRTPAEIAERIGCKVSSLRVRCSQLGISLRHDRSGKSKRPRPPGPRPGAQLHVALSPVMVEQLRRQAAAKGMTEFQLVAALLEAIARDDLYSAVLGRIVAAPKE